MLIAPVSLQKDAALLEMRALRARLCLVYMLTERRNAWHSTMINRYDRAATLFTSVRAAKWAAEKRRKAGSYFEIDDEPALVFDFGVRSLVLVNVNTSMPFGNWALPSSIAQRKLPASAGELLQAFSGKNVGRRASGWSIRNSHPTVIIGVTDSGALTRYVEESTLTHRKSYIDDGMMLYSSGPRTENIDVSAVDRIAWEAGYQGVTKEPADPRRLRVHQLAAQLGTDTKRIRELLDRLRTPAKGPRSWVEPHTVEEVRRILAHHRI